MPFYLSGSDRGYPYPECADLFAWNGWHYLLFKIDGGTRYRLARSIRGPWTAPVEDNLGNDYALVYKAWWSERDSNP